MNVGKVYLEVMQTTREYKVRQRRWEEEDLEQETKNNQFVRPFGM